MKLIACLDRSVAARISAVLLLTATCGIQHAGAQSATVAPNAQGDIVLPAGLATVRAGKWIVGSDTTAAGGRLIRHANAGAAKVLAPYTTPANYFEMTFQAEAGKGYRLWVHGRGDDNNWANDSVFVQFSGSLNASGAVAYRIGTTSAADVNLEECAGCGISGWTWQDNGYGAGVLGGRIYFAQSGLQTVRVQTREDGLAIDQILLSPGTYASAHPLTTLPTALAPSPSPAPAPAPAPTPAPVAGGVRLRVLQWNLHHGVGTDGRYDIDRLATWMARMTPDIVMLNEVEKYTGWGNEDQPARYTAMLKAKTGRTWYSVFAQEFGDWSSPGKGHLILSTYPFQSTDMVAISYDRVIDDARIIVNGRTISLIVTHLDPYSATRRLTQAQEVTRWAAAQPDNRILTGDMNAWPDQTSIAEFNKTYNDSWAIAASKGAAYAFSGLAPDGATKKGRIDYVLYSKTSANLFVVQSQVYDTRDSSGVMPSDHRPVLTTFEVR